MYSMYVNKNKIYYMTPEIILPMPPFRIAGHNYIYTVIVMNFSVVLFLYSMCAWPMHDDCLCFYTMMTLVLFDCLCAYRGMLKK